MIQLKNLFRITVISSFLLVNTGCAVRTRLGAIIPGHASSEQVDGEIVTATFIPFKSTTPLSLPGAGAIGGALAGVVVDEIRNEFLREAEKYEHQYSTRLLLKTTDLSSGGIIMITRWIDNEHFLGINKPNCTKQQDDKSLVPEIDTQIYKEHIDENIDQIKKAITDIFNAGPAGACDKTPVAALTLRVTPDRESVYRLSGSKVFVKKAGAKVVDFGWRNIPKIWQWPGALVFATDAQMRFSATMSTKALIVSKYDDAKNPIETKWTDVLPESDPLGSIKINLDNLPIITPIGSTLGSWIKIPTISGVGYAVMTFNFTESDSSNAKKYILQSADAIKSNKSSIVDAVTKAIEGK